MLDVERARSDFPALATERALFDNAGGSVAPRPVIRRVKEAMTRLGVQIGGSYPQAREVEERLAAGHRAAATLVGAEPEEVILGPSTTMNVYLLARALAPDLAPGDEVVVTDLDHEANGGAWRRMAEVGINVREWRFNRDSCALELADLEPLLTARTRLVCFTHCSNVVGRIHDAGAICRRVHEAGARAVVDGVAYAPHRRVDVKALDADFYLVSLYKVYGPHLGLLYGKREHLLRARGQNHYFIPEDCLPDKLEPGNVNHELAGSLPGILEYLDALYEHHWPGRRSDAAGRLSRVFELFAEHEERLARRLLEYLATKPGVRVLGPASGERELRAPTVAFAVAGRNAKEIAEALEEHGLALSSGHFYAHRAIQALGLLEGGGVVRASMVHYTTPGEVDRLIQGLEQVL